MLKYNYKLTDLYKMLTVHKEDNGQAMVIFDWYGLSKPHDGVSVDTSILLSKEELDEVNQVLKDRNMRSI